MTQAPFDTEWKDCPDPVSPDVAREMAKVWPERFRFRPARDNEFWCGREGILQQLIPS